MLPQRHRAAFEWFRFHAGAVQPWPQPLADGSFLATRTKGIYKPVWADYALSIRQTMNGPYPDEDPVMRPDGTWSYRSFQEAIDPADRDTAFTNRGLLKCWEDQVPVGVMR